MADANEAIAAIGIAMWSIILFVALLVAVLGLIDRFIEWREDRE
jgi:hypothetical protein